MSGKEIESALQQFEITPKTIRYKNEDRIFLFFPNDEKRNTAVRSLAGRKWSRSYGAWHIPHKKLILEQLLQLLGYVGKQINDAAKTALEEMEKQIILKGMSEATRKNYLNNFRQFLLYYADKLPEQITATEVRHYMLHTLREDQLSASGANSRINAIKFYFEQVVHRPRVIYDLPRPAKPFQLPNVLSMAEVMSLLTALDNIKHRTILYLAYSAGLRVSEVINLKIADIDTGRMVIHIRAAKGNRDRMVVLSRVVQQVLEAYYAEYHPKIYLFEGQKKEQYTVRSAQAIFNHAREKAGIKKAVTFHSLRHSYATHLLESGTDIRIIKDLLGHASIRTTSIYTHVSSKTLGSVESPLDKLMRNSM